MTGCVKNEVSQKNLPTSQIYLTYFMNVKYILPWTISTEVKNKTFTLFCISHHVKNPIEFIGHI